MCFCWWPPEKPWAYQARRISIYQAYLSKWMYWCIMINMIDKTLPFLINRFYEFNNCNLIRLIICTAILLFVCWSTLLNFCRYVIMDMPKNMCFPWCLGYWLSFTNIVRVLLYWCSWRFSKNVRATTKNVNAVDRRMRWNTESLYLCLKVSYCGDWIMLFVDKRNGKRLIIW